MRGLADLSRVSFRIFVKGGGGGKCDKYRVKGGSKDCTSVFLSAKNNLVFINLFILGRSGGMLPQGNFFYFLIAENASHGL